jgi:hypothetical protein
MNAADVAVASGGGLTLAAFSDYVAMAGSVVGVLLDDKGTVLDGAIAVSGAPKSNRVPKLPSVAWGGPTAPGFLVAWSDSPWEWATRVDSSGVPEAPFQVNDTSLGTYDALGGTVSSNGAGQYLYAWYDLRDLDYGTSSYGDLFGRILPAVGAPAASDFRLASAGTNYAFQSQSVADGSGFLVLAYDDQTFSAIRVAADGTLPDGVGGVALPGRARFGSGGRRALVSDGTHARLASDATHFLSLADVSTMSVELQPPLAVGAPVSSALGRNAQLLGGLATDGKVFLMVWTDDRNNPSSGLDVYARRFDGAGQPLDAAPLVLGGTPANEVRPVVASQAGGPFLVVWSDGKSLRATRIGASGPPLDASSIAIAANFTQRFGLAASIAPFPNGWLLTWEDGLGKPLEVHGVLIDASGALGSPFVVTVDTDPTHDSCAPSATWDGQRFFVAYEQPCTYLVPGQTPSAGDVFGRWIGADGAPEAGLVALSNSPQLSEHAPAVVSDGNSRVWAAWSTTVTLVGCALDDDAIAPDPPVTLTPILSNRRDAPWLAYSALEGGSLLVTWIDHVPLGARALRTDLQLNALAPALTVSPSTVFATPVPLSNQYGFPSELLPAPAAIAADGEALVAYELFDSLDGAATPRMHFRPFGLRARGASCGSAAQCSDGFCAGGVCCDSACDGVCQACDARGCLATPAADARCSVLACAALSTECRSFSDGASGQCEAFGRCATAGSLSECTQFTDAPDGTPCATGTCQAGSCVAPGDTDGGLRMLPASGCAIGGAPSSGWALLALLALFGARRRRCAR